jgi:hypothetical protein
MPEAPNMLNAIPAINIIRHAVRQSDLTRFRVEHVDLLFDRANDNEAARRASASLDVRVALSVPWWRRLRCDRAETRGHPRT